MQDQVTNQSRRDFIGTSVILATHVALSQSVLIALTEAAAAADELSPVARLRVSQRVLLGGSLYKDIDGYLAFAQVVRSGLRGSKAVAKFDQIILQPPSADDKLDGLDSAIRDGILIDCGFSADKASQLVSLQQLLSSSLPRSGLGAIVSRQVGVLLNDVPKTLPDPKELLKQAGKVEILPTIPKTISDKFVQDYLRLLGGDAGLAGLIAGSIPIIAGKGLRVDAAQTALQGIAGGLRGLSVEVGSLVKNGKGDAANMMASTTALVAAVAALGEATGMNKQTVTKIGTAVKVAGSVLSGAMAGATLGPVGAIAGGMIGLLGGLFGGSGGPDPLLQATAQLDAHIARLEQQVQNGFAQINRDMVSLSKQVDVGFNALSAQIRDFQDKVLHDVAIVIQLVIEKSASDLQDKMDAVVNRAREYEYQFRKASVDEQPIPLQVGSDLRFATASLMDTIKTAGSGFSSTAFVGPSTLDSDLKDLSKSLAKVPVAERLRAVSRFANGALPPVPHFGPGGQVVAEPVVTMAQRVNALSLRLRHERYALGKDQEAEKNGAGLIFGLQEACFAALTGIESSPEWQITASAGNQQQLLPKPDSKCPPPVAPQDLWSICLSAQKAASEISDGAAVRALLRTSLETLRPRVSAHYLLTGQNSLASLLYVRRRITAALIDDISVVFCNPYMAAVDVFRRAVSTELSKIGTYQPGHSSFRIETFAIAQDRLVAGKRFAMPFAHRTSVKFADATAAIALVEQELTKLFTRQRIDPTAPDKLPVPAYVLGASAFEAANFATRLPKVVLDLKLEGSATEPSLSGRLRAIQLRCVVLGVIEAVIKFRLKVLATSGSPVPQFDPWFEAFHEYGIVASQALAEEGKPFPAGVDPEFGVAQVVMQSMLTGTTGVPFPDMPAGFPEEAKPYPSGVGQLWGWGAELINPDTASAPELIKALLQPECAIAGENGAIMGCVETISEMQGLLQAMGMQSSLSEMITADQPGGMRARLRSALEAS